jgi:hypothetical protein
MKTELPLVLVLAEAKLIAGDVDIQLSSGSKSRQNTKTLGVGVLNDVAGDVQVDDVIG